jgi:hypothetical protein
MIGYQVASYRPYSPVYGGRVLGQSDAAPAVETFPNMSIVVGLVNSTIMAGAAWVGIRSGMREKGVFSGVSWTIGILAGIGGLFSLGMTTGLIVNRVFPKSNA